jgi:hypothetical protein
MQEMKKNKINNDLKRIGNMHKNSDELDWLIECDEQGIPCNGIPFSVGHPNLHSLNQNRSSLTK